MANLMLLSAVAQAPEAAEPTAFGFNAGGWIAIAMVVVILILLKGGIVRTLTGSLDSKIALIRDQLAEAESLRKEAETLRAEYEAKAASADKDREALLDRARHEADEIVAKAKTDAEALIERRTRMAEDKIAAEERGAIEQLRASAAAAASKAAARLIADRHDPASDSRLVNQAIDQLGPRQSRRSCTQGTFSVKRS